MAATESAQAVADASEVEQDRWPDLPENNLYRSGASPMMATQVIHTSPHLRRGAVAHTTDVETLRQIARYEARLEFPRSEVLAMVNQQIDRVRAFGLEGEE